MLLLLLVEVLPEINYLLVINTTSVITCMTTVITRKVLITPNQM